MYQWFKWYNNTIRGKGTSPRTWCPLVLLGGCWNYLWFLAMVWNIIFLEALEVCFLPFYRCRTAESYEEDEVYLMEPCLEFYSQAIAIICNEHACIVTDAPPLISPMKYNYQILCAQDWLILDFMMKPVSHVLA